MAYCWSGWKGVPCPLSKIERGPCRLPRHAIVTPGVNGDKVQAGDRYCPAAPWDGEQSGADNSARSRDALQCAVLKMRGRRIAKPVPQLFEITAHGPERGVWATSRECHLTRLKSPNSDHRSSFHPVRSPGRRFNWAEAQAKAGPGRTKFL